LRGEPHPSRTDHLDLYLLHWLNGVTDLSGVVAGTMTPLIAV
jgi:diketogulonate reductase-like aldo/keto reductase